MSKNATTKEIQPTTRGRMATRVVATCALLCALSVVFARFTTVMPSAISRFSIEAVPIALAGYFFGPIAGLMVGAVSDTVGCLFSGYGWDPVLTVSPMLLGLFAGLLRPVLYRMEKPWDFWRVAVTLLPGKVLGSVLWQSYWLIFLGYSKKAMGPLIGAGYPDHFRPVPHGNLPAAGPLAAKSCKVPLVNNVHGPCPQRRGPF